MSAKVRQVQQRLLHQGFNRLVEIQLQHRLFGGGWSATQTREVFHRAGAVAVLPYDPILQQVALVEQFRFGSFAAHEPAWQLEPVAGMMKAGENAEAVARRETLEEAGCTLTKLIPMPSFMVSPGCCTEKVYNFCGLADLGQVGGIHGDLAEGEQTRVHRLTLREVKKGLANGRFGYGLTIISLQWLLLNRKRLSSIKVAPWTKTPVST